MKKQYIIKVTKDDIKNGKKLCCTKCPVALALKRIFPHKKIQVGSWQYTIGKIIHDIWPLKVESFISSFDAGKKVKPFSFKLELNEIP